MARHGQSAPTPKMPREICCAAPLPPLPADSRLLMRHARAMPFSAMMRSAPTRDYAVTRAFHAHDAAICRYRPERCRERRVRRRCRISADAC